MDKFLCSYEHSLALKELGFDEECFGFYFFNGDKFEFQFAKFATNSYFKDSQFKEVTIPLKSQAFKFFREKYGLFSYVEPVIVEQATSPIKFDYVILEYNGDEEQFKNFPYHTYEDAENALIDMLIKICKDGKK